MNHKDHPYPTPEERTRLGEETGLRESQVSLWLANARRRHKPKPQQSLPSLSSIDRPQIPELPSIEEIPEDSLRILMPPPPLPETLVDTDELAKVVLPSLKPFDRWKIDYRWSQEPAEPNSIRTNITDAIARSPPSEPITFETSAYDDIHSNVLGNDGTASTSEFDSLSFWAQSMTSTSMLSDYTALSQPSSASFLDAASINSYGDIKPRRRCKSKRVIKERSQGGKFQCTFCKNRTFRTKHDWQRHEKSQHLNIESWACCAFGSGIVDTSQGPICAFCTHPNPSSSHLETHHYSACQGKGLSERTFYRKDHFKQHLVLVHECGYSSHMDIWKVEFPNIASRCGFCNLQLNSWQERVDHLAAHFKAGSKMADWNGGLGFDEHIAAIIDLGDDFDEKRYATDSYTRGTSSVGTHGSSLEYQADLGLDIGLNNQIPDDAILDTYVRRSFWCWSSNSSESSKGNEHDNGSAMQGGTPTGKIGLSDIPECVSGLCEDG